MVAVAAGKEEAAAAAGSAQQPWPPSVGDTVLVTKLGSPAYVLSSAGGRFEVQAGKLKLKVRKEERRHHTNSRRPRPRARG
jgi:hypothetical protein